MPSFALEVARWLPYVIIANASSTWWRFVSNQVPEPYLDEFFHVPQAQKYCKQNYDWDPKITTPPGLYLASLLMKPIIGCDTRALRALNVGAICLICVLSYHIRKALRTSSSNQLAKTGQAEIEAETNDDLNVLDVHTALNISLFPPLFFFSGLYYTDVMSTLVVLFAYYTYLKQKDSTDDFVKGLMTVAVGIVALLFRQTNIFWVAVFPAGLAVIDTLKCHGELFDKNIEDAGPRDYVAFFLYLPRDMLTRRPIQLLKTILPYLTLLALFGAFVFWNGGVVLGDKSAHVATLHFPQLLYFWPYTLFFSLPLALPSLLSSVLPLLPIPIRSFCRANLIGDAPFRSVSLVIALLFHAFGLAAVHYNTIVHPYTLADNRHYVFYVFRILLRHPAGKYLAVPVYYICGVLATRALGSLSRSQPAAAKKSDDKTQKATPETSTQLSFLVVWFAATALSVVTAPLVEPRYFIVPWIIWRLHVPHIVPISKSTTAKSTQSAAWSYDLRLVLETLWLLVINAGVGYVFLYWGFEWANELGKVQRFLW